MKREPTGFFCNLGIQYIIGKLLSLLPIFHTFHFPRLKFQFPFCKLWQHCWQRCQSGLRHTFRVVHLNIQLLHPVLTQACLMNFYSTFKRNDFIANFLGNLSTNSSIVTLGFVETICSMLDSKPISISLLHLFQFIDIVSQKLGHKFPQFRIFIITRSSVKT